jgi:hypothetical protein
MRNVELEAIKIANSFTIHYREYGRYPLYRRETLKHSKWWKFFFRAADMYSNLPDWDAFVWVACQFEKHGKRFPPQMVGQEAFSTFQEYKHRYKEKESDTDIASKLLNTVKSVNKWCKDNDLKKNCFSEYINNVLNRFALERRMVDPTLFTVSKSFIQLDEEVKERIMGKEDFIVKRASILRNEKIKNKMKEILGDDYG